jgi:ribonuclease BN (tRNA processing enzyme)
MNIRARLPCAAGFAPSALQPCPLARGAPHAFFMQIRVLGCSGSIAAGSRTTSFLLDDDVLIDAGTGVGDLKLDEMARIDHIFVTHSHLDHVLSIGLLADSVTRRRSAAARPPVQVHALASTLQALRQHVFNGVIWPDFTRLPDAANPVLQFHPLEVGQVLSLGQRQIEVLPASHTVPAVGYAVLHPRGAWVFTGDTGPNAALWQRLQALDVAMLVIETAFRDDEHALADISRHLCPAELQRELQHLKAPVDVYITHIKPGEVETVMAEIRAQRSPHRICALQTGQTLTWDHAPAVG